jgi:capsular exopolysaccharide synthesis family protein
MSFSHSIDAVGLEGDERSFDLRSLVSVFRRRWKAVLLPMVAMVVLASLYAATAQRIYGSDAVLLIEPRSGATVSASDVNRDPNRRLLTEVSVMEGRGVRKLVEDSIGTDAPKATAAPSGGSDTIKLTALSPSPARATETVNTYAQAYIDFRRTQAIEDLTKTSDEYQKRISALEAEDEKLGPVSASAVGSDSSARHAAIAAQLSTLKARLTQLELDAALTRTGGAQLISPGVPTTSPVSPPTVPLIGAAFVLGLALGFALALLREVLNDRLHGRADLEQLAKAPVLTEVATFSTTPDDPIGMVDRQSTQAEAFNSLRAGMTFLAVEGEIRSILITSALPEEGKSTVAVSMAATYALSGSSVLLIDADLRRPDVYRRLALDNENGLSVALSRGLPYKNFVQTVPRYTRLSVLTSGPVPPNPFELLASQSMSDLMTAALKDYDYVIVDCPPVLPVSDVMALARLTHGAILVVNAKNSIRSEVQQAVRSLRQVDAKIIGTVLNQTDASRAKYLRYD